jgi:hypothetical protein
MIALAVVREIPRASAGPASRSTSAHTPVRRDWRFSRPPLAQRGGDLGGPGVPGAPRVARMAADRGRWRCRHRAEIVRSIVGGDWRHVAPRPYRDGEPAIRIVEPPAGASSPCSPSSEARPRDAGAGERIAPEQAPEADPTRPRPRHPVSSADAQTWFG